ncbi:MAG TPA: nucleoside hydrolase [Gammaproteobacteria bacterium]|jgi:purine nucleosidase|nr:nucleoside hydrolase [Gammaproteobacteria bacterium]
MTQLPIIIDCDPGQDDAINLLLAMSSPADLDILGITTVAGNVALDLTTRNACLVRDIARRDELPVYAGAARPLERELLTAEKVHGKTGIDGIEIVEPRTPPREKHAVEFIIETLLAAADGSVTLVPTGPLTNIATALVQEPAIGGKVADIVLMGGAMREGGNYSPSAEFNMLVDPHAADIVFRSGLAISVVGLDVTHQVLATPARRDRIRRIDNPAGRATAALLDFYNRHDTLRYGSEGAPLHDPCTVAYLLKPELFEGKRCNLTVETNSELTMGHTAVDLRRVTDRAENVTWMHTVDADGFYDLLVQRLSRFADE